MKKIGVLAALISLIAVCTYADYYGGPMYDFGEKTPVSIQLADIDGDGESEILAFVEIADSLGAIPVTELQILKWSLEDSTFILMTAERLDSLIGLPIPLGFDVGELVAGNPGDEIVLVSLGVFIFGWDGYSLLLLSTNYDIITEPMEIPLGCEVADVDNDGDNEIVVGLNQLDTLNLQETINNILGGVLNPIVSPLSHARFGKIDGEEVDWLDIGDGFIYMLRSLDIDGDGYDNIVAATGDLDYFNANVFMNELIQFIQQLIPEGPKHSPGLTFLWENPIYRKLLEILCSNLGIDEFLPFEDRLSPYAKILTPIEEKFAHLFPTRQENEEKLNFDEDIVRIESVFDPPFPTLPGQMFESSVYLVEPGNLVHICDKDGFVTEIELSQMGSGVICVKNAYPSITEINDIIGDFSFVKMTEIITSKWIDPYTGQPEYSDTTIYPEPTHIPYALSGNPILGEISLYSPSKYEYWTYDIEPTSPVLHAMDSKMISGENGLETNIGNWNTFLTSIDALYTDFRAHLPDSIEWTYIQLPHLIPPLSSGEITAYTSVGEDWSEETGELLMASAVAPDLIFTISANLDYASINMGIDEFNSNYSDYYNEWIAWADDSLQPYSDAYDSCLAIHNEWALAYYDSLMTGGTLPPYPDIVWPDWPGGEPLMEEPAPPTNMMDISASLYNTSGTQQWTGGAHEGDITSFGMGQSIFLDEDGSYDYVFPYSSASLENELTFNGLYIYSSTRVYGVEEIPWTNVLNELPQNIPNPFRRETLIRYSISSPAHVDLTVYDISGRRVRTLVNDILKAGSYTVTWDGADDRGNEVTTGVYLYQIKANDVIITRKMLFIK